MPELRAAIDRIDRELVAQINERASIVVEIGKLKEAASQPAFVPGREEEVLNRVVALSKGPLSSESVRAVFREIISGSRQLEKQLRVAFLGPLYTYSHLATLHSFGQSVELIPVGSIAAVFEEVHRQQANYGLVPIENSTDGRIADTLDMFTRLRGANLWRGAVADSSCPAGSLPAQRGDRGLQQATGSVAMPQLAGQAFAGGPPDRGHQHVHGRRADGDRQARRRGHRQRSGGGTHMGWTCIAESIEDNPDNITRFAVIGADAAPRSGRDKTAAMFQIEHRPGSLAEAIKIFKAEPIESDLDRVFPIAHGEYLFFIELDGHETDLEGAPGPAGAGQENAAIRDSGILPAHRAGRLAGRRYTAASSASRMAGGAITARSRNNRDAFSVVCAANSSRLTAAHGGQACRPCAAHGQARCACRATDAARDTAQSVSIRIRFGRNRRGHRTQGVGFLERHHAGEADVQPQRHAFGGRLGRAGEGVHHARQRAAAVAPRAASPALRRRFRACGR